MIRLLGVEVRRLLARRLLRVLALLSVAGIALAGVLVFLNTESAGPAELEARRSRVSALTERCLRAQRQGDPGLGRVPPEQQAEVCRSFAESNLDDDRFKLRDLDGILKATTAPLVVAAWLIGASFIGADWQSRTLTTLLTWEPRRARVLVTKALACVVVTATFALVIQGLIAAAMLPSAWLHGTTAGTDGAWLRGLSGVLLRGTGLVAVGAVLGFSVASVGRNTAAALGLGFAYFVIVENVAGAFLAGFQRWLLLGNAIVLVSGESDGGEVAGRSVAGAALFLTAVAVVVLVSATAIFQRRDVA